jgi:hypothetical protein
MSCTGESNLQGLKHPSVYKAVPNEREELYTAAWDIVKDEVERLTAQGWNADKKGNAVLSSHSYKGANMYFYMIQLAIIVRNYIQDLSVLNTPCNSTDAAEKYKLDCVEEMFLCASKKYNTSYKKAWDEILALFGIDRQTENCTECCVGISEMIINDANDCLAFIIGGCDELEEPEPPYGEFAPCEFKINEFVEPVGDGIYNDCD